MPVQRALNIGPWIVAVDPGTISIGVCLSRPDGSVERTWSIRAPARQSINERLRFLAGGVRDAFGQVEMAAWPEPWRETHPDIELTVEDGVYRQRPKVCSEIGEARGLVLGEAFRRGWRVRKMAPVSWKSMMTKDERGMKKNQSYVAYWARRWGRELRTPDEVDSVHIARRVVSGRR